MPWYMRCFRGGSRRWRYRAAKRFRRQAKVGSGMIACSREATSWRSRRQVSGRVRRPGASSRPSGESPRVRRRAARERDDQEMGQDVRSGGAFVSAWRSLEADQALQALEAELDPPSEAIKSENV